MKFAKPYLAICFSTLIFSGAAALEYPYGANTFRLNAAGGAVYMHDNVHDNYLVRAQYDRRADGGWNFGAVYSIDSLAARAGYYARDAFLYAGMEYGRAEVGWTESVATKMGLVLPDVSGLRLHNAALFYNRGEDRLITTPTIFGNQYAFRANLATPPTNAWQLGLSQTVWARDFDFSSDVGLRYRDTGGSLKTSLSFGASYIDHPRGMIGDWFLPPLSADARYQATIGVNIQSGSLIWAATAKAMIDDGADVVADGQQLGTGISYEFLRWSFSIDYIFSNVGWHQSQIAHTGILSAKYKFNSYFSMWGSVGAVAINDGLYGFTAASIGIAF